MGTPLPVRTARFAATIVVAGCGGGPSCVDFDADDPPRHVDVVALSGVVTNLPEGFENDPPVPSALTVESVSEVSTVEVGGGWEIDVENGVSVVMVGDLSTSDMIPIYRTLVAECSDSGRAGGPGGGYESIVGASAYLPPLEQPEETARLTVDFWERISRMTRPSNP